MAQRGQGAGKADAGGGWPRLRDEIGRIGGHRIGQGHAMANLAHATGIAVPIGAIVDGIGGGGDIGNIRSRPQGLGGMPRAFCMCWGGIFTVKLACSPSGVCISSYYFSSI